VRARGACDSFVFDAIRSSRLYCAIVFKVESLPHIASSYYAFYFSLRHVEVSAG